MSDNTYPGIYKGLVVDNDDPEFSYRIVCQVPQVLGDAHSNWCSPLLPTIFLPRVGETVWIQFADGDPSQPLYMSRVAVSSEMIEPGVIPDPGMSDIPDLSLEVIKFKNKLHYLY
jgi:hypothetical protein